MRYLDEIFIHLRLGTQLKGAVQFNEVDSPVFLLIPGDHAAQYLSYCVLVMFHSRCQALQLNRLPHGK